MNLNPLNINLPKNPFFKLCFRHVGTLAWAMIRRYVKDCARETIAEPDFTIVEEAPDSFKIEFNDRFGYYLPSFNPTLTYSNISDTWLTEAGKVWLLSRDCHLIYLLCEMRGYLLLDNLENGDVVVDVGATEGFTSGYFARLVGSSGSVLAVEPERRYVKDFNYNMVMNRLHNVHLCRKKLVGSANSSSADTITLPELLETFNIDLKKVKMIKVDIEGEELELTADLIKFVSTHENACACIASYHLVNGEQTFHKIEAACKESPNVRAITIYAHHPETVILHKSNSKLMQRLETIGKNAAEQPVWRPC